MTYVVFRHEPEGGTARLAGTTRGCTHADQTAIGPPKMPGVQSGQAGDRPGVRPTGATTGMGAKDGTNRPQNITARWP
jgi:hypothetical protein